MSFFQKKMSQNDWATILPFGPVTNFLLPQKKKFRASQRLALISSTENDYRIVKITMYYNYCNY